MSRNSTVEKSGYESGYKIAYNALRSFLKTGSHSRASAYLAGCCALAVALQPISASAQDSNSGAAQPLTPA